MKRKKKKTPSGPNGQLLKPSEVSKTKEQGVGMQNLHSLAHHLVMWLPICLFEKAIFEVDASANKA